MKIYDIKDKEERVRAFEISSGPGRRRVSRLVENIPGVNVTRKTSGFSLNIVVPNRDDIVCEFDLGGIPFIVSEDWGDSSRYWIGAKDYKYYVEIETVREAFAGFKWAD